MTIMRNVCRAMERIAPLRLAEKWDNVGLLLEPPVPRTNANRVLLTIDLTHDVLFEALSSPTLCIISYHPIIFKPLSSLTLANPLQTSLLRCATAGISVYCPHTALDSVTGGINDWLCLGLNNQLVPKEGCVQYIGDADSEGMGGAGRILKFEEPINMQELIRRVKSHLGLDHVQVAYTTTRDLIDVESVAVCAGSGGSMIDGVDADVYFTGEMQHHDVLAAVASGRNIILCGHTNTERGYLRVLAEKLTQELAFEAHTGLPEPLQVHISSQDCHPLRIV
ncbi:NGG1p interacting factor 3 [Laetiporus sulphureus 93-53]|uniref:NGG1p interacting factor 3 n=1 Tax=Laetiporus sulphureus 93-53 TaxID=1314785 RepID=A0A165F9M6_9APHY|nr:NGG1p interacting factor 3 [Laetiporus sulphureus 93-53]KZT08639.1 NGG1p interacting factor 3 [Laetiporus sulphureus 93-53]